MAPEDAGHVRFTELPLSDGAIEFGTNGVTSGALDVLDEELLLDDLLLEEDGKLDDLLELTELIDEAALD